MSYFLPLKFVSHCFWIENLQSVLLLELKILLVEGVDSINHGLDKLNLGVSETVLVGDIIGGTGVTTRFTTGSTGLESKLLAPGLQGRETLLVPSGQVNMD